MIYNILELKRTGITYRDGHGRTVENTTSEQKATVKAKNGGEALKEFLNTLPLNKRGEIFKIGHIWIGTNENGRTTYTAQKI